MDRKQQKAGTRWLIALAAVGVVSTVTVLGWTQAAERRVYPLEATEHAMQVSTVADTTHTPVQDKDDGLPRPGMKLQPGRFAIVLTDPQVDFFSPKGVAWGVVGASVTENKTIEHVADLFRVAQETGTRVFISPHYYYPHDHTWKFEGAFERLMHDIHFADRSGALSLEGFEGSGADWLEEYKPFIAGKNVIVCSPHKMYGPQTNDLLLQLRKQRIDQVILAGMSANLCTESHLRHMVEEGFQVVVVADATAAAKLSGYDGYQAALVNFRMIASDVWDTARAIREIQAAR